jgi:hypothetical protein
VEQLGRGEQLDGQDRRVCSLPRANDPVRRGPPEPDDVTSRDVVRVEQHLPAEPPAEHRVAGVPGVVDDGPHPAALPAVRLPVPVLLRPPSRRARIAVIVEHRRDGPVAVAVQVGPEDPPQ